jgi:hypothetical protein
MMEAESAPEALGFFFDEGVQLVSQFHNTTLSQALNYKDNDCLHDFYGH